MSESVNISLEFTPNPNTLKYLADREIYPLGAISFLDAEKAKETCPLASELLLVQGIDGVMLGKDFVTVTKADHGDWEFVHKSALKILETMLGADGPIVMGASVEEHQNAGDKEQQIIQFLEDHVRPAVAMDGGDISFAKYEDGIVFVHLQGSCAGCPSSTMTLKQGIEEQLRARIPEIKEVVAL